jgi:hypothetical protein
MNVERLTQASDELPSAVLPSAELPVRLPPPTYGVAFASLCVCVLPSKPKKMTRFLFHADAPACLNDPLPSLLHPLVVQEGETTGPGLSNPVSAI